MKSILISFLCLGMACYGQETQPVRAISIDWAARGDSLRPIWAYFGYDEPNYTYMRDGKKLLSEISAFSPVPVYVRCHNLLTSGDGEAALKWGSTNAYTGRIGADGHPVYDWHIVDSIFDTYVRLHMRPLAEIGFTPEALSSHPQPYRHHWKPGVNYDSIYTGWAYPPTDYSKWGELVYQWVKHCVARYGEAEVSTWLWEVWNEPNISYWKGTREEYFTLYDHAANAVKRALPSARVGGPATTGPGWNKAAQWLEDFLVHCRSGRNAATGAVGAPLDLISFHAKGSPKVVDGHVRMNMAPQLKDVETGFSIVSRSAFPDLPIYITECDPEGCAACGMTTNPENAYRNGTMYSSYTAASFARIHDLAARHKVNLAGAMSWSFEFEDQRWFDGFRDLATNGVDKPVLNVFRMYAKMKGRRVRLSSDNALAAVGEHSATVMVWNYIDDDIAGEDATVQLDMRNLPFQHATAHLFMIDEGHSNAYTVWKKMGAPQDPGKEQIAALKKADGLQEIAVKKAAATMRFKLPLHAVALVEYRW